MNRITLNPHKSAALAYGGLGVLVILITFAAELGPPRGGTPAGTCPSIATRP